MCNLFQKQMIESECTAVCSQLGAGVSLPGVVAAKCGAQCLENCRHTCEVNELPNVLVVGITSPDLLLLPPLDILGSDIFYERYAFQDHADWSIEALLHKWNIPLEKFYANKDQHFQEAILYKLLTEDKEN
uniref:Uncharacterized protein n=1 Tax=Oncorhynchus kisutch TaxID=8019 RepID=A0A8C7CZ01_ONCKI